MRERGGGQSQRQEREPRERERGGDRVRDRRGREGKREREMVSRRENWEERKQKAFPCEAALSLSVQLHMGSHPPGF